MKKRLAALVRSFPRARVVVFGDLISDEYMVGLTDRVSREAPVLILKYTARQLLLGGAGNTAHNIRALGGQVILAAVIGMDRQGDELLEVMRERRLPAAAIVRIPGRMTTVKTRILAGSLHGSRQQVIRIDREVEDPIAGSSEKKLLAAAARALDRSDALLVSDYGLGSVTEAGVRWVNTVSAAGTKIVCIDSRSRILQFPGVTSATPNEPEAAEAIGEDISTDEKILAAGARLLDRIGGHSLVITRGKKGMALFERGRRPVLFPIYGTDEVADVTGAGDTVIGTFTLALSSGATPHEAALLATYAAGIVVTKQGTATVTPAELLSAIRWDRALTGR